MWQDFPSRPLDGQHCERSADLSKVTVPLLSSANWGGQGLHTRGNFEGHGAGRVETEMAGSPRRLALGAVLHRLGAAAEALLRPFSEGEGQWLGQAAARALCACAIPARNSSSATRTNGPSRAPSGPVPSPPAGDAARDGTDQVGADRDLRWHGRGHHLLHAAAGQGNGGDGPVRAEAVDLFDHG